MSKTHTGDVTAKARKLAKWMAEQTQRNGPPSAADITARAAKLAPHMTDDDILGIVKAGLALFKKNDPDGYSRALLANVNMLGVT